MPMSALKKEKKNFISAQFKNVGLIKKLINKSLYTLLNKKNAAKM